MKLTHSFIKQQARLGLNFFRYLLARMNHDRVNVNAGYLAYITLLSMVPMLTVLLSILSSFALFANAGEVIQDFVITICACGGRSGQNRVNRVCCQYGQDDCRRRRVCLLPPSC